MKTLRFLIGLILLSTICAAPAYNISFPGFAKLKDEIQTPGVLPLVLVFEDEKLVKVAKLFNSPGEAKKNVISEDVFNSFLSLSAKNDSKFTLRDLDSLINKEDKKLSLNEPSKYRYKIIIISPEFQNMMSSSEYLALYSDRKEKLKKLSDKNGTTDIVFIGLVR